jgi:hypothetical protein
MYSSSRVISPFHAPAYWMPAGTYRAFDPIGMFHSDVLANGHRYLLRVPPLGVGVRVGVGGTGVAVGVRVAVGGTDVGVGVRVAVGGALVAVGVAVRVRVGVGVAAGAVVAVGVGVRVDVAVGTGVFVANATVGVDVGTGVFVANDVVGVAVGTGVFVTVAVAVGTAVFVGVGVSSGSIDVLPGTLTSLTSVAVLVGRRATPTSSAGVGVAVGVSPALAARWFRGPRTLAGSSCLSRHQSSHSSRSACPPSTWSITGAK